MSRQYIYFLNTIKKILEINEKVIEKTWPAHILIGHQESPEKRMGVFIESIMVQMEFEVSMGLYRKGVCLIK